MFLEFSHFHVTALSVDILTLSFLASLNSSTFFFTNVTNKKKIK